MNTKDTLYNTYVNAQRNNAEKTAIFTRENQTITHGMLLEEIDKAAAGLLLHKTEKSFKVGIISSSSYEEAVFLLAVNKIGAVSKFIDFTKNVTEISESIAESSIALLVMGAEFLPMEPYINPSALPVVVLGESPLLRPHYQAYRDFLESNSSVDVAPAAYESNKCAVIINSSGTTGTPKPIELSDRAMNAAVVKMAITDYPLHQDNLLLKIIPSHIGMGLITSLYTGLILGVPIIYLAGFGPQESIRCFVEMINGYDSFLKVNHLSSDTKLLIFGAPMYFRALLQLFDQLQNLSFIGCMLAGGSAMSKEELEIMDAAFASKGCCVPVLNGYGQNEMAGAVTLNRNNKNCRGSAGVAVSGTELLIVDMQTGVPVKQNKVGTILERSESLFIQYENMAKETKASFITINSQEWFNTHDVGYLDEDGFLFITGRTSRIIIRFDMKVSLDKMESKIRMSKYVKEVGVVSQKGDVYDTTVAFVLLNDEYKSAGICPDTIIENIQQSRNPLNEIEKVDRLFIVDDLPYRSSGKIDYRALEKQAEDMRKA